MPLRQGLLFSSLPTNDRLLRKPVLVLNIDALKGNASPKTLISLVKMCMNYFDQNPGSFSVLEREGS